MTSMLGSVQNAKKWQRTLLLVCKRMLFVTELFTSPAVRDFWSKVVPKRYLCRNRLLVLSEHFASGNLSNLLTLPTPNQFQRFKQRKTILMDGPIVFGVSDDTIKGTASKLKISAIGTEQEMNDLGKKK